MQGYNFDELPASLQPSAEAPSSKEPEQAEAVAPEKKNLVSALDHFEEAMEKEAIGNMGDSLHLYRRAYRVRPSTFCIIRHTLTNHRWTIPSTKSTEKNTFLLVPRQPLLNPKPTHPLHPQQLPNPMPPLPKLQRNLPNR